MEKIKQIFSNKDLKKRIFITITILVIYRFLAHVPIPGVSLEELRNFFNKNQVFGLLNLFTGGAMRNFSIVMMGVGPYITSSIIFQLLVVIVPQLEQLQKEGEQGRQKINYYTRLFTVPLAILQSYSMIVLLKNQGIVLDLDLSHTILTIITMTAGSILLMWLGELISEKGIGNGLSLIITLGIIANLPVTFAQMIATGDSMQFLTMLGIIIISIITIAFIIYITEGERRVPVTYARRVRGHKTYGGVDTHLPIRVNMAGVIPIIFAVSMMIFPGIIAKFFLQAKSETIVSIAKFIENLFQNNTFYAIAYFLLVILFTYFYTSVIFQPKQIAENLQKQGGFIPGIRPGNETVNFLNSLVGKIVFIGAMFLAVIAVMPYIIQAVTGISTFVVGGTSILIVVSVIIETARQINAQLIMTSYDKY